MPGTKKLILNDGTELDNSYVIQVGARLWVYIYGSITFQRVFELLNDPTKTTSIICDQYGKRNTYDGFTDLFCMRKEDGGWISAGLRYPNV